MTGRPVSPNALPWLGATVLLSALCFAVFFQTRVEWSLTLSATRDLLDGLTHWPAYQNRLAGPAAVRLISALGIPYEAALAGFVGLAFLVHNLLLFAFLLQRTEPFRALLGVAAFCLLFLALQNGFYYTWDALEAITALIAAQLLLTRGAGPALGALALAAFLNRESALFIAVILLLDGLAWPKGGNGRPLTNAWIGLAAGAIGVAYTIAIRKVMFVETTLASVPVRDDLAGNHFNLADNLQLLFVQSWGTGLAVLTFCVIGLGLLLGMVWIRGKRRHRQLVLLVALNVAGIFCFGLVDELRIWIPVASMTVLLAADISRLPRRA